MRNYILIALIILFSISQVKAQCIPINQLLSAYSFSSLQNIGINGSDVNVTIVDAYGAPNIFVVNNFFEGNNIPPLSNSTLKIYYPYGKPTSYNSGWETETLADIEMVHSIAPGAHILLVIAPNDTYNFLALNWSIYNLDSKIISISWGTEETPDITSLNSILENAYYKGINIIAATGDSGAYINGTLAVNFPAGSQYVLAVGGTELSESNGVYVSESGWSGSGGGVTLFPALSFEPSFEGNATIPDVSINAGTPVCLYNGTANVGIYGTSIAAPTWAGFAAMLYGYDKSLPLLLPLVFKIYHLYGYKAFNPINEGCNGYYCANGSYNLVTGIGSPKVVNFFNYATNLTLPLKVSTPGFIVSINGKNYSTPFSLNLPYYSNVSIRVYPTITKNKELDPLYLLINNEKFPTTTNLVLNETLNVSIMYITKYALSIVNYRPGINITEYFLPGTYNISIGKYALYYKGEYYIVNNSYLPYNTSLIKATMFYNPSPSIEVQIANSTSISLYWIPMKSSLIISNINCVRAGNATIGNNTLLFYINETKLSPCTKFYSKYVETFEPTYPTFPITYLYYENVSMNKLIILDKQNNKVNVTLYYSLYGSIYSTTSSIPSKATPLFIVYKGIKMSVTSYEVKSNETMVYVPLITLKISSYLIYPIPTSFSATISFYNFSETLSGFGTVNIIAPPNYNLVVTSFTSKYTYNNSNLTNIQIVIFPEYFYIIFVVIIAFLILVPITWRLHERGLEKLKNRQV